MNSYILYALSIIAIIILACVFLNKMSSKIGVPVLLAFIAIGMIYGNAVNLPLSQTSFDFAERICSIALIFIIFYGGYGTRWSGVKKVVLPSALLASLGVAVTMAVTGLFCHFVLKWGWLEALLMGSVISSTDAASVFSILRSRKLGLKNGASGILEMESGSNDPMSNILTIVMVSLITSPETTGVGNVIWQFFAQMVFGAAGGFLIAMLGCIIIKRANFKKSGFDMLLVIAIALLAYALPSLVGGNGYLSVYIVGIVLGNRKFEGTPALVNFFDGITSMMQMVIFCVLGFLSKPSMLLHSFLPALAIFGAITLLSRPVSIFSVLLPFRKYSPRMMSLVSFSGLRGAASIVFAIIALSTMSEVGISPENDIFSIVFVIVLLSIGFQGTLLPHVAKKLDMIDDKADVMRNFNDFAEENEMQFNEVKITPTSIWKDKEVRHLNLPKNILMCLVIRTDGSKEIPNGSTVLHEGDKVVIGAKAFIDETKLKINEEIIDSDSPYVGMSVKDYPSEQNQILVIRRSGKTIIPNGSTVIKENDILFLNMI